MEIWRSIKDTNGSIYVSTEGRIRSDLTTNKTILKLQKDRKGYLRVSITIDGTRRTMKVHREVAKAFIDNPDNLPQVNHINGDKSNNSIDNLEWCDNQYNATHAIKLGLWTNVFKASKEANEKKKTPIITILLSTGEETRYESMCEAQVATGTRHINEVIKGKRKQANGYSFRYAKAGDN